MRISEISKGITTNHLAGHSVYAAKVRLSQNGYKQIIDTTVVAKTLQLAIKLLRAQYGKDAIVGNPRRIQDF